MKSVIREVLQRVEASDCLVNMGIMPEAPTDAIGFSLYLRSMFLFKKDKFVIDIGKKISSVLETIKGFGKSAVFTDGNKVRALFLERIISGIKLDHDLLLFEMTNVVSDKAKELFSKAFEMKPEEQKSVPFTVKLDQDTKKKISEMELKWMEHKNSVDQDHNRTLALLAYREKKSIRKEICENRWVEIFKERERRHDNEELGRS